MHDTHWSATLGGFTQQNISQALGFPPGTKITINEHLEEHHPHAQRRREDQGAAGEIPEKSAIYRLSASAAASSQKGYASGIDLAG